MNKKTAYRAKGGKTGSRKGKGPKLIMDPKILDKMTNKEIANMLAYHFGAEGIGAKKKGGTVGLEAGGFPGVAKPAKGKTTKPQKKKPSKPKGIISKQYDSMMQKFGKKPMTAKKGGRVSSKSKSGCKPNRLY